MTRGRAVRSSFSSFSQSELMCFASLPSRADGSEHLMTHGFFTGVGDEFFHPHIEVQRTDRHEVFGHVRVASADIYECAFATRGNVRQDHQAIRPGSNIECVFDQHVKRLSMSLGRPKSCSFATVPSRLYSIGATGCMEWFSTRELSPVSGSTAASAVICLTYPAKKRSSCV